MVDVDVVDAVMRSRQFYPLYYWKTTHDPKNTALLRITYARERGFVDGPKSNKVKRQGERSLIQSRNSILEGIELLYDREWVSQFMYQSQYGIRKTKED